MPEGTEERSAEGWKRRPVLLESPPGSGVIPSAARPGCGRERASATGLETREPILPRGSG
jgi:hypothetical protein